MKTAIILFFIFILCAYKLCKADWIQCAGITNSDVYCFTGTGNLYAGTYNYGIFRSTNNGINWQQFALYGEKVMSISADGNCIFAGTWNNGLYRSTNSGLNWSQTSINNSFIFSVAVHDNFVFAGTEKGTTNFFYRSSDYGETWSQTSLNNILVLSILHLGNIIYAGTSDSGIYKSTDNGLNWYFTGLQGKTITALSICSFYIYAGCANSPPLGGIFMTSDNGLNWEQTSLNQPVYALSTIENNFENNIFAGTHQDAYFSSNNGANWITINEGLTGVHQIYSFRISGNYIVTGTVHSAWYRSLSELIGIKNISQEIPVHYSLTQNYPNPFNPTTKINFSIPPLRGTREVTNTKLIVYDMIGREVAVLVDEQLKPGEYEVEWNGINYSSGIYFYKLVSDNFQEVKRMVLIK